MARGRPKSLSGLVDPRSFVGVSCRVHRWCDRICLDSCPCVGWYPDPRRASRGLSVVTHDRRAQAPCPFPRIWNVVVTGSSPECPVSNAQAILDESAVSVAGTSSDPQYAVAVPDRGYLRKAWWRSGTLRVWALSTVAACDDIDAPDWRRDPEDPEDPEDPASSVRGLVTLS